MKTPFTTSVAHAQAQHAQAPQAQSDPEIPPSDITDLAAPDLVSFPVTAPPVNTTPTTIPFQPTDTNYWADKDLADLNGAPTTTNPDLWPVATPSGQASASSSSPPGGSIVDFWLTNNNFPYGGNIFESNSGRTVVPDCSGTIGRTHYIAVVNRSVWIYKRVAAPGSATLNSLRYITNTDLSEFMHYTKHELDVNKRPKFPNAQPVGDVRIIYDRVYDRYIVVCISIGFDDPNTQYIHMAVSRPFSASSAPFADGNYYTYHWNVARVAYDFWDQPGLGQDQNAIIITGNIYGHAPPDGDGGNPYGADMFSVRKTDIYYGLQPRNVQTYRGLQSTLQPPNVLDSNANAYLICAPSLSGDVNRLLLYRLTNTNQATTKLYGYYVVPLPRAYRRPRSARQLGTSYLLDTQDVRFQNMSTQVGNSLFQAHCIDYGGYPVIRYYEINTLANSINQYGTFYYKPGSDDFNPHIAADDNHNVYVTWNSCSPTLYDPNLGVLGMRPTILCSYHLASDPPGYIHPPAVVPVQSPAVYTDSYGARGRVLRWGDYSQIAIDPLYSGRAWGINEYANTSYDWGAGLFSFVPGGSALAF